MPVSYILYCVCVYICTYASSHPHHPPHPRPTQPTAPTDLVLPDTLPRLEKTLLLDEDTGMELSWMVAPDRSFVDIQVGGWVGIGWLGTCFRVGVWICCVDIGLRG